MIALATYKNSQYTFYINTTPAAQTPTFRPLAAGIKSFSSDLNENVHTAAYLCDEGWSSSDVTGAQLTLTLSGDRVSPDDAQDYVFSPSVMYGVGEARQTSFKIEDPAGNTLTGPCTLAAITCEGGDADAAGEITIEIHFNGKPVYAQA